MGVRVLQGKDQVGTDAFGVFCPYWRATDDGVIVADNASDIISKMPSESRVIDPTAVLELLQFNHVLGGRTLVEGISRMPWRASLLADGRLTKHPPLPHGDVAMTPDRAAIRFQELLVEELLSVCRERSEIYLLLTGGLDSRIVAGTLKTISAKLSSKIRCVTWGSLQSRDYAYAKRIADWFGWDFIHVPIDAESTWKNIQHGAHWGGAEVAGFHLHGMEFFSSVDQDALVIASSFGDSIGRAEFSSVQLRDLSTTPIINFRGLIHSSLESDCIAKAESDRRSAWAGEEKGQLYVQNELDKQENYMRRMICHAMDFIRQFCAVHQAFTSEEIVRFAWSLRVSDRGDEIYHHILKNLDSRLFSLPWARTGVAPDGSIERDQKLTKRYEEYGKWLRTDLRDRLHSLVFSKELFELGVFRRSAVQRIWQSYESETSERRGLTEKIANIAAIELMRREFDLQPCRKNTPSADRILEFVTCMQSRFSGITRGVSS